MAFGKGCCLLGAVILLILQPSNAMKLLKESGIEDTPCNWPTGQQYWPHPTNCRMFVQCTPNGPQGMHCAPGTAWSQSLLTCDFEANTDCGKHQPTSPPESPSTSPPKAPSTSKPESPSTSPPKAPSTSKPESPSTSPPKASSTSKPESPSTSPPKSPSTAPPPENKVTCPSPYKLRGDECFFVSEDGNDLLDWDESRQRCLSMGGDLAQPQDMVDFVEYIKESYSDSKSTIWLGATDRDVEQDWHWVSGEAVPPAMWKPWPANQPSGDGNCMEIHWWPNTGFYMNDWHCHKKGHFACEVNMAKTETPKSPTTAPPPENTEVCPSPYKLRGTECLFVSEDANDLLDWDESRQRCLSMDGDLAQPQDMVQFVAYIEESYPNSKSTIWLGATDREVEQDWYWVSGEPVPPAMWKPWPANQPSGDGNCMEIHWWPHTGFYMNDWHCHNKGHFACEFNMIQD